MKRIGLTVAMLATTIFLAYFAGRGPRISAAPAQGCWVRSPPPLPNFMIRNGLSPQSFCVASWPRWMAGSEGTQCSTLEERASK
jgi:hypothetical protein